MDDAEGASSFRIAQELPIEVMGGSLRVLILEDRDSDAELVVHALKRAGYPLEWRRADSEATFVAALGEAPELIIADYNLPQFTGLEAVRLVRARGDDVPFIVVSGTIGEELAVECLKAGANDYLLKDRLARLGHAVSRARAEQAHQRRQRAAEAELAHHAVHDPLTGLPNRSLLRSRLHQALHTQEAGAAAMALLLLNLDRFRDINDTLGYQVGDSLLIQVGQRLSNTVGPAGLVARLGGDEFAILLPDSNAVSVGAAAADIQRTLQTPFVLEGQEFAIDVSIGIALAPEHGQDADNLLRRADIAMYRAKGAGTGPAMYRPDQDRHRPDRLALSGELRTAIERGELVLHYQPKLDLRDGSLVGVEALARWQHPTRGFLSPTEFVPVAEQTGLIYALSIWVLEAALQQHRLWRAVGIDVPMAVNLSRRMLHDQRLPEVVAELLSRWDAAPTALVLEITEGSLMADPARARENLAQLRSLGVHISIDDFGTGYSSLASLKALSVDELKIDQSFVRAMAAAVDARAIVRAIIDLADALDLNVVAEGVEDQATWDVLAGLGCDVAQGYFLSPPVAAAEFEAWVAHVSPTWRDVAQRADVKVALAERTREHGARLSAEEEFIARKVAEAALQSSEERNRLALQAAGMGTWDWDVIGDAQAWSSETEALNGLAPGTFAGTFDAFKRSIHPEDWPAVDVEQTAMRAERRDSFVTYRSVWPDGNVRWLEGRGRAMYSADGTLIRVTGTTMDITERKLAEAAVRASEERFRNQYKGFPLPTYSWLQVDDDFVLQDFNDAAEAATPGMIVDGVGGLASEWYADNQDVLVDLHTCVAERRTIRREMRYRYRTTGLERDLAVNYVFVPPQTVMAHIEDITDARHAERQRVAMAQSEKVRALGQMATGIAHDLNQSLMLVSSYSDLARQALVMTPPNLAEVEDLLTTTTQAALDGGETVKRLLLFTRAAPDHDTQAVELAHIVHDAAQLTAPRWRDAAEAEGRPISLHIEGEARPRIEGSPAQLRELLTNLIFNAVDALPTGGTIRLRVLAADGRGIIEVADSGIGMSAEVQERVFEPFFTTKGEGGTGLGLAMVFRIVEQHSGQIEIRSAPGDGTTFRMSFPLVTAASAQPTVTARATMVAHPGTLRVLAVDDEPMMTRAVVRMLKPSGHVVSVAASGEEALQKLAEQTFDVVVSDMGMGPGMNGWELAEAVKCRWPHVHFILATGWGAAIDPAEARAKGVHAVLSKPYHPRDLLRALAQTQPAA